MSNVQEQCNEATSFAASISARANTGATAAPKLSVGQQRRHCRRATKEKLQREGRAACGYVDNPMRQDAGRQARRWRGLMREICTVHGEPPPAWAAKRAAGKAQSHTAKAMGLQPKAKAPSPWSGGSSLPGCAHAVPTTPIWGVDDPEI